MSSSSEKVTDVSDISLVMQTTTKLECVLFLVWLCIMTFSLTGITGFMIAKMLRTTIYVQDYEDYVPTSNQIWRTALQMIWTDFEKQYDETFKLIEGIKHPKSDVNWFKQRLMELTDEEWQDYLAKARKQLIENDE
jgi:hypothetical protein